MSPLYKYTCVCTVFAVGRLRCTFQHYSLLYGHVLVDNIILRLDDGCLLYGWEGPRVKFNVG